MTKREKWCRCYFSFVPITVHMCVMFSKGVMKSSWDMHTTHNALLTTERLTVALLFPLRVQEVLQFFFFHKHLSKLHMNTFSCTVRHTLDADEQMAL